jgi:hypothetical protein
MPSAWFWWGLTFALSGRHDAFQDAIIGLSGPEESHTSGLPSGLLKKGSSNQIDDDIDGSRKAIHELTQNNLELTSSVSCGLVDRVIAVSPTSRSCRTWQEHFFSSQLANSFASDPNYER